jgi:hypothetical protein
MAAVPRPARSRSARLVHQRVRAAFGADPDHPARPATIVNADRGVVDLRFLDGTSMAVSVLETERLAEVLGRGDLCRLHGDPLVLVNTDHAVLGVATGPPHPPASLEVLWVSRLDDGTVVEVPGGDDTQPSWQTFALG